MPLDSDMLGELVNDYYPSRHFIELRGGKEQFDHFLGEDPVYVFPQIIFKTRLGGDRKGVMYLSPTGTQLDSSACSLSFHFHSLVSLSWFM